MRRTLLTILIVILSFAYTDVYAAKTCRGEEFKSAQNALGSVAFSVNYADNATDINGDLLENYFRVSIDGLPEGYYGQMPGLEGGEYIIESAEKVIVPGGVYTVNIKSDQCDQVLKVISIKLPSYKDYCNEFNKINCNNVWFDGTYEDTTSEPVEEETGVNVVLIVILVTLVIIIVGTVIIVIKKRREQL